MGTDEMQAAFRHAVAHFNRQPEGINGRRYELQALVDIISTADTVKLSRLSKLPPPIPPPTPLPPSVPRKRAFLFLPGELATL